jgi:hypothetical protein
MLHRVGNQNGQTWREFRNQVTRIPKLYNDTPYDWSSMLVAFKVPPDAGSIFVAMILRPETMSYPDPLFFELRNSQEQPDTQHEAQHAVGDRLQEH